MEQIENTGMLQLVLGTLERPEDFIRCSAVSRAWSAATKQVRVTRLCIGSAHTQQLQDGFLSDDTLSGVTRWLHSARDEGMLRDLSSLSVYAPEDPVPKTPRHSVAMFDNVCLEHASLCPLQTCYIQDSTNSNEDITAKLPVTLQSISLKVVVGGSPDVVPLNVFEKFTALTSLHMSTVNVWGVSTEYVLDGHFACLEKLKLPEGLLVIQPSFNIAFGLRNLRCMTVNLPCIEQQVQAVLDLPLLQVLTCTLLLELGMTFFNEKIDLIVQQSSSLQSLTLNLEDMLRFYNEESAVTCSLQIAKRGVNLTCENVQVNLESVSE